MSHQWCDKHWKPYQTELGGLVATARVMQAFIEHPIIMEEVGVHTESAARMNRILKKYAPVCCFLGETHMNVILIQTRVSSLQIQIAKGWSIDVRRGEDEAGVIWTDQPLKVYGVRGPLIKQYEFITELAVDGWRIVV